MLDDTLTLRDLGMSAFDGSNIAKGALGAFLESAREGLVPNGSVLLVESFDRLSRADTWAAFGVFRQIIDQGITVVTLADGNVFSPEQMQGESAVVPMLTSIIVMARAHEESARKSQRVRAAWRSKRENAGLRKLTSTCPQWMRLTPDRSTFELIPEKVSVVRKIIELQMNGVGQQAIVKLLNQGGILPINYRSRLGNGWHPSTIQKICTSPALYGAYQPTTVEGNSRVPAGEIIEGYYPALLTKAEFHTLQLSRRDRLSRGRGAKGAAFTNIFSGLLKCGYCGGAMNITTHKPADAPRTIRSVVCSNAKRGLGCHFILWGLEDLERTVMTYMRDVDITDLIGSGNSLSKQILEIEKEITGFEVSRTEVSGKLARLVAAIETGGSEFEVLKDRFAAQQEAKAQIDAQVNGKQKELAALKAALFDVATVKQSVLALYEKLAVVDADELYQLRARLAAQIRKVVKRINVYPGGVYLADVDEEWVGRQGELDSARRPDRSFRRAEIVGSNGRPYFTSTVLDARAQGHLDHAETLETLGQAPEAERSLRRKENRRT
ncbi:DNA invertase Pin-like site-specific DNA recombinase [Paraburkholderia caledonica]|uniref:DNA invertase Pin-like site-specific DNA recombinase n=2 Tax=Paraburkholderia caledonica TaxID=134536 RepID=A0ABU1KTA7_9BURK|nr:DNA invertase Pin-like site-specific DNA recombinase [Paraburkholderia caledonica]